MAGGLKGPAVTAGDRTPYDRTPYGGAGGGTGGKARHLRQARGMERQQQPQEKQQELKQEHQGFSTSSAGGLVMAGSARRGPYDRPSAGRHASAGPQAAARRSGTRAGRGSWIGVGSAASRIFSGASSFLSSFFRRSNEEPQQLEPMQDGVVAQVVTVEEKVTEELDIEDVLSGGAFSREQCDRLIKVLQSKLDENTQNHVSTAVSEDRGCRLFPEDELSRERERRPAELTPETEPAQDHLPTSPVDIAKAYMGKHLSPAAVTTMPLRTLDYWEESARKRDVFDSSPRVRVATPGHTPYVRLPPTRSYTESIRPSPFTVVAREKKRRADEELDFVRKTRHKAANGPPVSTYGNGNYLERMKKIHKSSKAPVADPVPMQSTVAAKKILETLEILTPPKGKRLEEEMAVVREKMPEQLSPSMLNEQARKSMQTIEYHMPQDLPDQRLSTDDAAGPSSSEALLRVSPKSVSGDTKGKGVSDFDSARVEQSAGTSVPAVTQQQKGFRMSAMEELNSDDEPLPLKVDAVAKTIPLPKSDSSTAPASLSIGVKPGFTFPFMGSLSEPTTPKPMPSPIQASTTYSLTRQAINVERSDNAHKLEPLPSISEIPSKPETLPATPSGLPGSIGINTSTEAKSTSFTISQAEEGQRLPKRHASTIDDQTNRDGHKQFDGPALFGLGKDPASNSNAASNGMLESSSSLELPSRASSSSEAPNTTWASSKTTTSIATSATSSSGLFGFSSGAQTVTTSGSELAVPLFSFQSTTTIDALQSSGLPATSGAMEMKPMFETEVKPLFGTSTGSLTDNKSAATPATSGSSPTPTQPFIFGSPSTEQKLFNVGTSSAAPFTTSASGGSLFGSSSSFAVTNPAPLAASSSPGFSSGSFGQTAASPFSFGASTSTSAASVFSSPLTVPFGGTSSAPAFGTTIASPSSDMMEDAEEPSQPTPQSHASTPAFGSQQPFTSAFGASQAATGFGTTQSVSPFGTTESAPAFGSTQAATQSAPAFGTTQAAPSFSATQSAPSFGATQAAASFGTVQTASPFGATQPSVFGGFTPSAPAFAAAQSTPAFGTPQPSSLLAFGAPQSSPAFGAQQSAPAFGALQSTPVFGAPQSTPAFGAPQSTPAFGAAQSTPAFGAPQSTPAFGVSQSAPAFGAAQSAPAFGAAQGAPAFGAPAFGAAQSAPVFGASQSTPFGAPQSPPVFSAGQSAPVFGATTAPAFGAAQNAPAFTFGASQSAPAFGSAPGFGGFGANQAAPDFSSGGFAAGTTFSLGAGAPASADPSKRKILRYKKTGAPKRK